MNWLTNFWYQKNNPLALLLLPLHWLLVVLVQLRRWLYSSGIFKTININVPVIIVGNISVGGTGKSPLVIHLAKSLSKAGYKVGIVSRGYGGNATQYPMEVVSNSLASEVGDEPLMIKQRLNLPVAVDPQRVRAAQLLVEHHQCDLIIADDGLQHYQLERDIELLVVDGLRGFGNGLLMPFGPLREPKSRSKTVDAVVINGGANNSNNASINDGAKSFSMELKGATFVALSDHENTLSVEELLAEQADKNKPINAVAAIGHPQRFFSQLESLGLDSIQSEGFDDHHRFVVDDFANMDGLILMTEKDAVKCRPFATNKMWYLKVDAEISPSISQYCIDLLKRNHYQ